MLSYQSEGNGKTIVLLHAFPLSSTMWEKERKEIGQYTRVLTPDLPGFGASARQKVPSISGMAEEVARLRREKPIDEFRFGQQDVRTKVKIMSAPDSERLDFDILEYMHV